MHGLGFPQVAIGNALGRRPSTISRELRRNRPPAPGPSYLAKWAGAAAPTPSCDCSSVALTLCRLRTDNPAPLVVGDDDADLARESPVLQVTTPAAREPFAAFSRELLERLPLRREEARRAVLRHAAPSPAKPAALSLAASRTPRNAPCPCGSGKKVQAMLPGRRPHRRYRTHRQRPRAPLLLVADNHDVAGPATTSSTDGLRSIRNALHGRVPGPLLVQGEAPKHVLLDRFRASGSAVLVATMSFWEGVDVPGSALRLVALDKIPFAVPSDPIVAARCARIEAEGGNPFTHTASRRIEGSRDERAE